MSKYYQTARNAPLPPKRWEVHPIWRGIGCLMMIIIPVMAYAGAILLVQANLDQHWLLVPYDLGKTVAVPLVGRVEHLYGNLVVAAVLALLGFGLLTALFSMMYSMAGPPQLGPLDAPPMRRKDRKRKLQKPR